MARVLFIYSVETPIHPSFMIKQLHSPELIYMGISYISAVLKQHGHQTSLLVLNSALGGRSWTLVDGRLRSFSAQTVCMTAVATQYSFITKVARQIKSKYPDLFLLIGGPHVSLNPEEAILDVYDAICIGEGEYPTLEYISQLEEGQRPSSIPNMWIKKGGQVERNSTRNFLPDLDSLPFPDREMWWPWIEERPDWRFAVLLGRGCPFSCTYCSNHALRKLSSGSYVRWRSPENIVREITDLCEKYPINREFYLEVETISVNRKWALELCLQLKHLNESRSDSLSFGANLRLTDRSDLEELFAAFREANFRFVNIGLESGSERVRREILRREYSNDVVMEAVTLARRYGLQVAFFNLIGLPGETMADFKETVRMNRICQPDWHFTSIFFPYAGTDLYKLCLENGLIKKEMDTSRERREACLDLPGFSRRQIRKCYTWFNYHVYHGRRPLLHLLYAAVIAKVRSNCYSEWVFYRFRGAYIHLDRWTGIRSLVRRLTRRDDIS